ncbi:hypothetical protein DFH09DRAFT_1330116 [Mycena vulgaris]|nr:hypothetical protein DFH09DRAFT_1330116 [Mycena vulgaris]
MHQSVRQFKCDTAAVWHSCRRAAAVSRNLKFVQRQSATLAMLHRHFALPGAKCALVGRPYAYGLALGGEDGVRHALKALCEDLVMNMHLAGLRGLDEVNWDILVK